MWSKKWCLEMNISFDAHLLNKLLETDDVIVVPAGKLRKLWDSLSELCSTLCDIRLQRTAVRPVLLPVKTEEFIRFFSQV
jgi:hypothetical protein